MDFDEYEYLEKTSENPELLKVNEAANGGEDVVKSGDKGRKRRSSHRDDENNGDLSRRSKHSKSGEERDQGSSREKGSSRHRSRSRDGERREKDRHRSSREHRDKDKDREERNGKGKDVDRDRTRREMDNGKEKRTDRENDPERRRSRSHSVRHQSERDEKDRERSRERDIKEKERRKVREMEMEMEKELRDRERESRRHKEKKEERVEPEVDPERDQRTVFAYQICLKADERDVYEFFSRAGKVRDVRLIMDRNSRRSKGVGYIEFYDAMSVPMAIALSGQPLLGKPVMVKPSEAEKNLVQSTTAVTGPGGPLNPYSGGARRLYVGNLHFNITEDQLRQVFEAFGTVELVQLPRDETGNCKGFGFVQFARLEDAKAAQSLNGQLEIAGRIIKVSAITEQTGTGMPDSGINAADFDDDEGGGLALNAHSRAMLMQKLDRSNTTPGIPGSLGTPAFNTQGLTLPTSLIPAVMGLPGAPTSLQIPSVDMIGVPSECLMLKNMFDPTSETEPDFDLDIKEDVEDECSKYGKVKHIFVDKNSAGHVYLRFDNTQAAMGAQKALHGRWFAGKMITAMFMVPQNYEAKFPESR